MKIVVFADIHGSVVGMETVAQIAATEKAQKVVFCGDLFGRWASNGQIAQIAQSIDGVLYFVRGNNDGLDEHLLDCGMEDNVLMYHFGRKLFFTHGDRYNGWLVPPVLEQGDAVIFGHTHVGSLTVRNGLFALNVGSVARPRDGVASYLLLDEQGATLCKLNGEKLYFLPWNE
ncbi:MAG: metallophosphoesterase family protein [Candidatus Fimimonas sp.]